MFNIMLGQLTVIFGFIVLRFIISTFGAELYGLKGPIVDFIGNINLLQTGFGSTIYAMLYKSFADRDQEALSIIVKTTEIK